MTVSLNWLKEYTDINLSAEQVSEILTSIGLEVEGMEDIQAVPGGLLGFVTAQVLTCERFEVKEKKLSLCTVNIGADEPSQIVCGAPNVAAGQKVIVATVGTQLYNPDGSTLFAISSKKTYGHLSEGMICAEDEMNIGQNHEGIMILPEEVAVGIPAAQYFNLDKDTVFEIGLTPNRSDATCHLGVAKDLAAALKVNHAHAGLVKTPAIEAFSVVNHSLSLDVQVEKMDACPRYTGVCISNVRVGESPEWLKKRLAAVGVRSINNIVDITNFIVHELGQPLHAFDYDKINGQKIIVKTLPAGTKFKSLDEQERTLLAEDLMICDGNDLPMCIGGVFGGFSSGVTSDTVNIFLESAHFNAKSIRRSSMKHGLRTDSAKVFEKGSDPNICIFALKRAALLIQELTGGTIASDIVDIYPQPIVPTEIEVAYENITKLVGEEIPKQTVIDILTAMGMEVRLPQGKSFIAVVPTNKTDVLREVDIIEEILRIYGFDNIKFPAQIKSTINISDKVNPTAVKNKIADYLAANGYNEMMGLSMSQSHYYKDILPVPEGQLVLVNNTANAGLDTMRPTMLFAGLEAIVRNQNRQNSDLRLFEFGKTYLKKSDTEYIEAQHLTLFVTGKKFAESWLATDKEQVSVYALKNIVVRLLQRLGIEQPQETVFTDERFSYGLRYHRGTQILVEFGKLQSNISKKIDIKNNVYYADFQWDTLLKALQKHKIVFEDMSKYPNARRDLALVIEKNVNFAEVVAIARKTAKQNLKEINLFDVYENAQQLGETKKSYSVSFVFEDKEKTLEDKEIDANMNALIKQYEERIGALIRK